MIRHVPTLSAYRAFAAVRAGGGVACGTIDGMLIVTPNPAIDHTIRLAELRPGEVIRTGPGISVAGGKGGNVTRAARLLGATDVSVLAFVPRIGSEHLHSLYAAEGFDLIAVPVDGRVRTCTAMIEHGGRVTLLNEPGAAVDTDDWQRLLVSARSQLERRPGIVVCSGSLPPGAPVDGYAQIVRVGHDAGAEVIVDASRAALVRALDAGADLVCPNVSEAEAAIAAARRSNHAAVTGGSDAVPAGGIDAGLDAGGAAEQVHDDGADVPARAADAAARLHELGARWAVVTAGSAGAAVAGPGTETWFAAPAVTVHNPIGAGDSFLAGVATARLAGGDWLHAIRRGIASGSASVEQDAAGVVDPGRVDELERQIAASGS
jgi:fructose-1-phosphate kinase PfkB-like protein